MFTLHAHSNYSILRGTIPVEELIAFAVKSGSKYVSLTDTNGMYGLIHFAKKAIENNIKPVLGTFIDDPSDEKLNAVFLAKNNEGYSLLCRLITNRKLNEDFNLADFINTGADNLFILTSSIGLLEQVDLNNIRENLYAELIVTEKQKKKTRELYEYAKKNNIKIAASHPAYFIKKEDYLLYRIVNAIRENTTLANQSFDNLVDEEFYLKTPAELDEVWKSLPEATQNADYIAENCNVDLELGKNKFPVFPLPEGETSFSFLWKIAHAGLAEKYDPVTDVEKNRLDEELSIIDEMGFSDYFLVVWDIVQEAKKRNMMMVGRGSAANSIVSYCLGFSQVDPIKYNFYFERFLNRTRSNPPDIDLDFSWRERDEIVKYVFDRYGYDKVAMISTTVTFRARSAFRETAKVFGISDREISKYSKFIPWTGADNLPVLAKKFPESKKLDFNDEPWKSIIDIASKLASFPRHLSIHASGIVVSPKPINNYLALEFAKNKGLGLIITQPDMYQIEDIGLVKIDLLSQRALGVLRDTINRLDEKENKKTGGPIIYRIEQS